MSKDKDTRRLFKDGTLFDDSYEAEIEEKKDNPVECLGMTFPNDEERRKYFLDKLRDKLKDSDFRKIDGFPIGSDEDILALSDPPYYTACPNPFLEDFIKCYGKAYDPTTDEYHREPFAVDVSEGKNDPIYKAHSYHTKVPHLAIIPSILHYTNPGDVILDGFCGSGMTGIATQWCTTAPKDYLKKLEEAWGEEDLGKPQWGLRRVVLNDLSPAATFIAANFNIPFDVQQFARTGKQILDQVEQELGWMYKTVHRSKKDMQEHEDEIMKILLGESPCPPWLAIGKIEYTVWSEVFTCPDCAGEVIFLDEALDKETKHVKENFPCPHCSSRVSKQQLNRSYEATFDKILGKPIQAPKRKPSMIVYSVEGLRYEKIPDLFDMAVLKRINSLELPKEVPPVEIPPMHMTHERARMDKAGVTHIHHFFLPRAAHALASLWRKANVHSDERIRHMLLFFVEQGIRGMSLLNRYKPIQYGRIGGSQVGLDMPGVYYISSIGSEVSPLYQFEGKLNRLYTTFNTNSFFKNLAIISTSSTSRLGLSDKSVDYIFTDPPFGENIYYADLNFLVESWHRVITNAVPEAIVDKFKKKGLLEYQRLMQQCFKEYYRVLKPGRWMTVVFHNSRNAVWNAIQEAMQASGFVVADVRTLDKQQGSYRQVTSTAVKQDLVISGYKPNGGLEDRFKLESGTEEGVWDFVRTHLKQLPKFVSKDGKTEVIAERLNNLLYDRMVAFHVLRGVTIPMSAPEFYAGLARRFPERDGMYFLPDQVAEYDKKRMTVKEILQLQLFVTDESSAIQWLKQQLAMKPQTFQELHPQFMKEIGGWNKQEKPLELSELLEQNFLCYDGKEDVPSQIHSYLSTNFKELRKLPKDDLSLKAKAKDRWYIPDPNKAGDLEKLRERALLREFEEYKQYQKKFKSTDKFRLEAVRAGFSKAWHERDYITIINVANKIPENILHEDSKLMMWHDGAVTRTGGS